MQQPNERGRPVVIGRGAGSASARQSWQERSSDRTASSAQTACVGVRTTRRIRSSGRKLRRCSRRGLRTMNDEISRRYDNFYRKRDPAHVYPVEFVVRAFLGNYPRLKSDNPTIAGKWVLDLGFGDGRNMPLLHNLGMQVFGVEISQEICDLTHARMRRLGIDITTWVGRNDNIPFDAGFFDTSWPAMPATTWTRVRTSRTMCARSHACSSPAARSSSPRRSARATSCAAPTISAMAT